MYTNAPIHDLLIRIKNAYMARRPLVQGVIYSTMKESVLKLLKEYKFIKGYEKFTEGSKAFLSISLYQVKNKAQDIPVVTFKSKPWRRWYVWYKDLKSVANGQGIGIISTSKGVMPTHIAKKQKLGGELFAEIY